MMDDIGDIMQTESGRALIQKLANNTNGKDARDNSSPGTAKDAANFKSRQEHQAAGLGKYASSSISENAYRRERRKLAYTPQGMPGDLTMPTRDNYSEPPTPYSPFFGR